MNKQPILKIENLKVHFNISLPDKGFFSKKAVVKAVDGVSININEGEILGIVGESGCGKSTLAKAIVGLVPIKEGNLFLNGKNINDLPENELRNNIQMIFQSPLSSLNPRFTVFDIVSEPLKIHYPNLTTDQIKKKVNQVMLEVGLSKQFLSGYPHEFSGGQCQRIGIARALVLEPKILICDEPISALDVSIQSQIINLLQEIRINKNITLLFIAHDLAVVRHVSDRILIMYLGKPMEIANKLSLYENPIHPYTKGLLAAVPIPDPILAKKINEQLITGEIPSPINPPSGCVFRTRCPEAIDKCSSNIPSLLNIKDNIECSCILRE